MHEKTYRVHGLEELTSSRSPFTSVDPAPPLSHRDSLWDVEQLKERLLDAHRPLFERYRAMFALRDTASHHNSSKVIPAIHALATGFSDRSALFRHEIAFVFGQLSHPASIPSLVETLKKSSEACMVRHEAAEALGGLGAEPGVTEILRSFVDDPEEVVRESIVVALDMAEYEKAGDFQYALTAL